MPGHVWLPMPSCTLTGRPMRKIPIPTAVDTPEYFEAKKKAARAGEAYRLFELNGGVSASEIR